MTPTAYISRMLVLTSVECCDHSSSSPVQLFVLDCLTFLAHDGSLNTRHIL